nr:ORF5 [Recilia dorsalis filamentous virus]
MLTYRCIYGFAILASLSLVVYIVFASQLVLNLAAAPSTPYYFSATNLSCFDNDVAFGFLTYGSRGKLNLFTTTYYNSSLFYWLNFFNSECDQCGCVMKQNSHFLFLFLTVSVCVSFYTYVFLFLVTQYLLRSGYMARLCVGHVSSEFSQEFQLLRDDDST